MMTLTIMLLLTLATATAQPAGTVAAEDEDLVRMAFSSTMFDVIDRDDALIALQLWADELAGILQENYRGESVIYEDAAAAVEDVLSGHIALVALASADYIAFSAQMKLTPAMVPVQTDGRVTERYALVVRVDSPFHSWEDLRGADVGISPSAGNPLPIMWADVALASHGLGSARTYFRVRESREAAKVVLPVFFSQLDACVVIDRSLATLAELNPQVGRELRVIDRSAELLDGVTSFGPACSPDFRAMVMRSIHRVHETPQGRLILDLFGRSRVVPFREEYLLGVRELVAAHAAIPQQVEESVP